ncbi:MAG: hypothetical protein IPH20_08775 [Bacteroidales bacterium]|nr:hypothetical protein [Bacteroidales bacterium]
MQIVPYKARVNPLDLAIYELDERTGTIKLLKSFDGLPSDENFLNQSLAEVNRQFDKLLEIEELCQQIFFQDACQETQLNNDLFGICDDQNGRKAYTSLININNWVAKVQNGNNKSVVFTAIDNCISIVDENGNMTKRCDGMLTYADNVVFVELKDKNADWISQAVEQLETTIQYFLESPEIY